MQRDEVWSLVRCGCGAPLNACSSWSVVLWRSEVGDPFTQAAALGRLLRDHYNGKSCQKQLTAPLDYLLRFFNSLAI